MLNFENILSSKKGNKMKLFRDLSEEEEREFRQWARDNYEPLNPILGIWHPVVQDECKKMNQENGM
jgi:hypothetical protein